MKPGPKPKGKVSTVWGSELAYAVGLLTADGCLSKNGRHIDFTSKDREQVMRYRESLGLEVKISTKRSGIGKKAYRVQFGDVLFYQFLEDIGLTPAKSKTLGQLHVPRDYFRDFVRGYFDGDGCSYSFYDSVFTKSFRFYISFASASPVFLAWLQEALDQEAGIKGRVGLCSNGSCSQLKYSKREAIVLATYLYQDAGSLRLQRKYLKIQKTMGIIAQGRSGEIGKHATFRS